MKKISVVLFVFCISFGFMVTQSSSCTGPGCTEESDQQWAVDILGEIHAARTYNDPVTNLVVQDMVLTLRGNPCEQKPITVNLNADHYVSTNSETPSLSQAFTSQSESWDVSAPGGLKFKLEQSGQSGTEVAIGNGPSGTKGLSLVSFEAKARDSGRSCEEKSLNGNIFSSNGVTVWYSEYSNRSEGGQTNTINTGGNANFVIDGVINAPHRKMSATGTLDLKAQGIAENDYGIVAGRANLVYTETAKTTCPQLKRSVTENVNLNVGANNRTYSLNITGSVVKP